MPDDQYELTTRWRVEGTCGEVADVLTDPLELARWWPSVYLEVRQLEPRDAGGLGGRVWLRTKGWLPYSLRWEFSVVESRYPHGFAIAAQGDLTGRGVWTIEQDGRFVNVTYDWRVRAGKALLRRLSFILKPMFEANHRWAMDQGKTSLELELARRRATSDASRAAVPAPPGPVTHAAVALLVGAAALGGGLAYLVSRSRRRSR